MRALHVVCLSLSVPQATFSHPRVCFFRFFPRTCEVIVARCKVLSDGEGHRKSRARAEGQDAHGTAAENRHARCFDPPHDDDDHHPSKHPDMPVLCAAPGKGRPKGSFKYTKTDRLRGQRQPTIFTNFDPGREGRKAAELEQLRAEQEAIERREHQMAIEGVVGRVADGLFERTAIAVLRNKALWRPEWVVEMGGFRTGAGKCIMCEKPTGAARKKGKAKGGRNSNRVVLMQSGLGLYCRSQCGWPSFGWCGAKSIDGVPTPCTEEKISPQDTCGDCFWVCFNCYDPIQRDYAAEQKKKKRNAAPSEPATVQPTEAPEPKRPRKYKKDDFDDYCPKSKQRSDKDLQQNLTEFSQATSSSTNCAKVRIDGWPSPVLSRFFFL